MKPTNNVFIATSLDGYIADPNGGIEWLHAVPNPDNDDMGYSAFMAQTDALVMGRRTFETVCGFDMDWPYDKPVFVLSRTMEAVPADYQDKARLVSGALKDIVSQLNAEGFARLYIDGGTTIQSFLRADLIDAMTITVIPILLGGGIPLFGALDAPLAFACTGSKVFANKVVQHHFQRTRAVGGDNA